MTTATPEYIIKAPIGVSHMIGICTLHGLKHPMPSRRPTVVVVDSNHRAVLQLAIPESTSSSTCAMEVV